MPLSSVQFDDIVVGGGTTGAVIASRLSEDRERRVLLLEAGPDYPDTLPNELLDASYAVINGHNWNMQAVVREGSPAMTGSRARVTKVFDHLSSFLEPEAKSQQSWLGRQATMFPYPLGRVMGGGSAINGCMALHARPEDYARWAVAGGDAWSWERVQPYMSRITTADSSKSAVPIETAAPEDITPCQRAFLEACQALGNREVNLSQGTIAGVGTIPKSVRKGQRVSTATLYLAAARNRSNLTIRSNCMVDRLILERSDGSLMATAVEALVDGVRCRFSGGHITISAGAINSPAILLRSGIGATGEIVRGNLTPMLDLPGVGKNLQDHPSVSIWATPRQGSCLAGEPVHQLMAQQRSTASEKLCDVQVYMLSAMPSQDLQGLQQMTGSDLVLGVSAVIATPSSRGHIEVANGDATTNPRIYLNCLEDPEDLRRMMEGVRAAWRMLRGGPLDIHIDRILLWTQNIIDSDVLLENLIRATVRVVWHPVGTLRMGKEGDAMAVVDPCGRLYGCLNVTVADASILPTVPSVPPNLTCMLIGERIAAGMRGLEA
ncbi:MAG TPA: GMC family oxidoreductase [Candidatus Angelobacter sp.]|jgi:choline dehydrogenase|nr:GMC family oxidoreductase [Candidatus Angelobacter sp.]